MLGSRLRLPTTYAVYAALLDDGVPTARYEAAAGPLGYSFWPASSIKVLAAEGALAYLATFGFTGSARVTLYGATYRVSDLYTGAITASNNEDYDLLVLIAGVDFLNTQFLTATNGFPRTVIQKDYAGYDLRASPEMTISEGERTVSIPAR